MKLTTALLWVSGVVFFGLGVLYTLMPELLIPVMENPATSGNVRTELRAVYGGMELGIGTFLAMCAARSEMRVAGLWSLTLISGLTGLVRFAGFFFEGT